MSKKCLLFVIIFVSESSIYCAHKANEKVDSDTSKQLQDQLEKQDQSEQSNKTNAPEPMSIAQLIERALLEIAQEEDPLN